MAVDKVYFIFRTFDTCLKIIIIIAYNCQIKYFGKSSKILSVIARIFSCSKIAQLNAFASPLQALPD